MVRCHIKSENLLGHRYGEHGKTHSEPSDLREGDHRAGKITSLDSETSLGKVVQRKAAFGSDVAQGSGVSTEDGASQKERPDELRPCEAVSELLTHPHAGREESESQHDHEHAEVALAPGFVDRPVRVVHVNGFIHTAP